jgi:hypothetical protein
MPDWREYVVTIERSDHGTDQLRVFGCDRNDVVKFVQRVWRSRLRALISARLA